MHRPFTPRALGEIAIRCIDYPAMQDFYGRILGLTRLTGGPRGGYPETITFFRFGESYGGHVAVLALFAPDAGGITMSAEDDGATMAGERSSLHHIALSLPWDEQEAAATWLKTQGHEARFVDFEWTGWRGLFTSDPDGNTVELVAASPDWHLE